MCLHLCWKAGRHHHLDQYHGGAMCGQPGVYLRLWNYLHSDAAKCPRCSASLIYGICRPLLGIAQSEPSTLFLQCHRRQLRDESWEAKREARPHQPQSLDLLVLRRFLPMRRSRKYLRRSTRTLISTRHDLCRCPPVVRPAEEWLPHLGVLIVLSLQTWMTVAMTLQRTAMGYARTCSCGKIGLPPAKRQEGGVRRQHVHLRGLRADRDSRLVRIPAATRALCRGLGLHSQRDSYKRRPEVEDRSPRKSQREEEVWMESRSAPRCTVLRRRRPSGLPVPDLLFDGTLQSSKHLQHKGGCDIVALGISISECWASNLECMLCELPIRGQHKSVWSSLVC